jgi:GxxExxY protein
MKTKQNKKPGLSKASCLTLFAIWRWLGQSACLIFEESRISDLGVLAVCFMKTLIEPGKKVDELAHAVIGAAIEAHRHLGPGFLEGVYEEALCIELAERQVPFERQKEISVLYKGRPIGKQRIDLTVGGVLIVELKAIDALAEIHKAQVISYLKATRLPLGLLINFNIPILKNGIQRVVYRDNNNSAAWRSLRLGG